MAGCVGCSGGALKGSFPFPAETLDISIRRAAAKVLSGRASYIRMTVKDADVSITPHRDIDGECVIIIIDYSDDTSDVYTVRE